MIQTMLFQDDVYSEDFFDEIFIQLLSSPSLPDTAVHPSLVFGTQIIPVRWIHVPAESVVASGPYVQDDEGFRKVFRLFEDHCNAFTVPLTISEMEEWDTANANASGLSTSTPLPGSLATENSHYSTTNGSFLIGIPSRLYYNRTDEKPLSGLRFAVKDTIDVKGTKTCAGSLAYQRLHPQKNVTAPCVQHLSDLGAILIGKTKTAQFADGDTITGDCVDYPCPWNPRGDGYLIPSGSSSGSASAIAAYDWLDFSVGTDSKNYHCQFA